MVGHEKSRYHKDKIICIYYLYKKYCFNGEGFPFLSGTLFSIYYQFGVGKTGQIILTYYI